MHSNLTREDVEAIIEENGNTEQSLISILLQVQESSGQNYIDEEWAGIVASKLNISLSRVYDVITFYSMFSTKARGKYVIEVCKSATCHVTGAKITTKLFEDVLGIRVGETTKDGMYTLQYTSCIGACNIGPAMKIGENVYGHLTRERIEEIIQSLREGKACQNN